MHKTMASSAYIWQDSPSEGKESDADRPLLRTLYTAQSKANFGLAGWSLQAISILSLKKFC